MIIVLDSNVIISGVLKPYSPSGAILRFAAEGILRVAYDLRILAEYRDVLTRPKFNFSQAIVDAFLAQIEQEGILVSPRLSKFHLSDPDDDPFLEVALAINAMAIITGNKRHFPQKEYEGVKILSPAEFLKHIERLHKKGL
jgi:putative PIN family toxin of toxin-antitoxin system